jgi:biotin synthase
MRWTVARVLRLFELPFPDLVFRAQEAHRAHHSPSTVQLSRLISIKTAAALKIAAIVRRRSAITPVSPTRPMLDLGTVVAAARAARADGATRFCMGAAWRGPKDRDLAPVLEMVREVKALGLETCCTLGLLKEGQAEALKSAGLDYYNHNVDTAPEFYGEVITTRDLRRSPRHARSGSRGGISVCCGGIVGMGETRTQRAGLIAQLASMDPYPESVPINHLVQVPGTPLHGEFGGESALDPFEFVRTVAAARITMPKAVVRLSAGRRELGRRSRRCAFSPAPTRSFTATSCSPRAIPASTPTVSCSTSWE